MHRRAEQLLHRARPGQARTAVDQPLQIAHLMRQTQLKVLRRGMQLWLPTITHPDLDLRVTHHALNHAGRTATDDAMVNRIAAHKDPLPPDSPVQPRAGLITADHRTLLNLNTDRLSHGVSRCARAFQDARLAAFTQVQPKQVTECLAGALGTEMLLMTQVDDRRFQPWPKGARRLQPAGNVPRWSA